ncbi:PREDICTED: chromodomain-helicase-DNA-binding protein 7-like [Amphimedon queenslandica]|uniref:Chromodomain-helicase-DNA-binding protein 6-9 tri-helical domain-containing protein n=1 Tax=Amphimedon queenslandica TaxID=400682 RepID=A0AAN0J8L1_AMPQE|nr:PREDICTED: chromodomain-helicase-DNA-binding protein 7-like [Amphimedon queenslandica]|eukprot:XP_019853043.1 PREDICTED: chromodomain-helicase-DNA-binding protein 7-like [Amphimedon queenslandica]
MLVIPAVQLSQSTEQYIWPSLAEINTRSRRLVNAYLKQQKREELRHAQLIKEQERKEREAEVSRKRELKKAELAQKWSKREEQDFGRIVSYFGIEYEEGSNKYDWTHFRQLANLGKKTDDRLTLYFHDFKEMCRRVIKRKRPKMGYSGVLLDPVTEDKAIKCLQRLDLLSAVRREILPHPQFDELIKLCQASFEVPHWWIPDTHDRDLLKGVAKHGLYRTDFLLYNDPELSFLTTVPQSALFIPTCNNNKECN